MDNSQIETFLDDVISGLAESADVADFVRDLDADQFQRVLAAIRSRVSGSVELGDGAVWAPVTARILLAWAVTSRFDKDSGERPVNSSQAAAAASEIFRSVVQDSESADFASLAAGVLSLDPAALSDVYERYGDALDVDTRMRLLRLLTGSGDAEYNRRYGPVLAEVVSSARSQTGRTEIVEKMQAVLDGKRTQARIEEAVGLLEQAVKRAPRDDEFRRLYIDSVRELDLIDRGQNFLLGLSTGFHDDFRTVLLTEASGLQMSMDGGHERALQTMESAVMSDPSNAVSLDRYMRMAIDGGDTGRARLFLESVRTSLAGTPAEINTLKWQGRLLGDEGRDDDAEKVWRRIRAIDTRSIEALDFYVGYHERKADWQKQFSTLQFELSILENDEDRIRVNRVMAEVAGAKLNKLDKAAEAYKRILAITPSDDTAFEALVDILEKSAKWHALVELFNDRIRRLPADDVLQKVSLLFRIVDIYQDPDKQPNQDSMLAAYARIVDVSPTNERALETLEAGYESSERWPDLLKVLQRKVEVTDDPVELLDLFHRISEIAINRMSNETQAIPFLEKILELDPQNLDVVQRLKAIYGHKHNQERQYVMLRRELGMVGPGPEREPILLAAAEMARDRLLKNDEALDLYEEAYRLNGRCREARENLHLLYNRLERWADYARFLTDEVECQMPTVRRIELLHKLGEINMDHLGDIKTAEAVFSRVLEIDPADEVGASRLERIYIEQGQFERIYEVYKGRGEIRRFVAQMSQYELSDARLARDLSLVMSRVCTEDLKDPARALDHLEDAFIADPAEEAIGRRVIEAAAARNDQPRIERTLKVLAANGSAPAARQADYMALHDIYVQAGRLPEAFDAAAAAIRAHMATPALRVLVEKASNTAESGGLWQALATLLDEVSGFVPDLAWRRDLLMELGRIYLDRLLFHDDARKAFERVLEITPDDTEALDILENIVIQQEDYAGLEGVLQRRLSLSTDAGERQNIHMRLGSLYEDLLNDDMKASEAYAAALEDLAEPDRTALSGLHRTFERLEMHERLAETIKVERNLAAPGWDRSRLDCELASVLSQGLGRVDEALGILDGVLSAGPDEAALAQTAAIFASGSDTALAGSILQAHYQREGMVDELLKVLETRLERTVAVESRAAILVEIANIRFADLNDAPGAFKNLVDSVVAFPTEENVRAMIDMAASVDGFAAAADVLESRISSSTDLDPALEAWMSRMLGGLYGQRLGNPELAITAMERALPFEDGDPAFLADLLTLYRAVDDTDSAMTMFTRLADTQKDDDRRKTLMERAIFASSHSLVDEAVQTLRMLAAERHDPEADSMLEELLEEHGRFADLISHLVRKTGKPGYSAEVPAINFRIAGIYLDHMKLPPDAARYIELAVAGAPDMDGFVLFAESMISDRSARNRREWVPGLIVAVRNALKGREGVDDRLITILRMQVELAESPEKSAGGLRDIADIECARGNRPGCFEALTGALQAMPGESALLDAVLNTAREAGFCREAVEKLLQISEGLERDDLVRIRMAAAAMAIDDLGDHAAGIEIYKALADRYPDRDDVLKALDRVYTATSADADRVSVLCRIAELSADVLEQRKIKLEAGRLAAGLGDARTAFRLLKAVVDGRPDDFELDATGRAAATLLVDSATAVEEYDTAADMLVLLGSTASEPGEMRDRYMAAAGIIAGQVGDVPRALTVLLDVLKEFNSDSEARAAARDLARQSDNVRVLLTILDGDVELAADDESKIPALLEIAHIQVRPDVGNQELALTALDGILAASPGDERALAVLRELFSDPEFDMRAAGIARTSAEITGDRALLVDVLRVQVRRTETAADRAELLGRIGAICVETGRDQDAIDAYGDALAELPADGDAFKLLFNELTRQSRVTDVVSHVRRTAPSIVDIDARNGLRVTAAEKLAAAGENAAALELLQDALVDREDDQIAILMTTDIARACGDWERYATILKQAIRFVHVDDTAKADAWLECAGVYSGSLNDQESAIECYREVMKVRPLDRKAIDVLSGLLEGSGDSTGLRALWHDELAARLAGPVDGQDRQRIAWLLIRIAETAIDAGAPEEATDAMIRLVQDPDIEPGSMDAASKIYKKLPEVALFDAITSMLAARGESRRLLDLYRFVASRKDIEPGQEVCLRRAIEIEDKLRLHDFRFEDLGRLVETVPGDMEAVRLFVDAGRKLGRIPRVVSLLERTFAANQDTESAFDLAIILAELLESDMNRLEDASGYLRLAFLRHPDASDVVGRLSGIYTRLERFGELALLHENLGELTSDPEQRIRHYFNAYEVLRKQVQSPEGAAEILKKVLDLDPVNTVAVEGLEAIARETGNPAELAVWIGHRAEMSAAPGERRRLRLELAGILDALGRRDDAVEVLDQLVEEFPDDDQSWALYEKTLISGGNFEALADMYTRMAGAVEDDLVKMAALKKAASVFESRLDDRFSAIAALENILQIDPADNFAFERLSGLLEQGSDYENLLKLYASRAGVADEGERVRLNLQMASILREKLGRPGEALECFVKVIDVDPSVVEARSGLLALVSEGQNAVDAALALERVFIATGEHDSLIDILDRQSQLTADPAAKVELLVRMASVQYEKLNRPAAAVDSLGRALAVVPGSVPALDMLCGVARDANMWRDAYSIISGAADSSYEDDDILRLRRTAGDIAMDRLQDPAAAAVHYGAYLVIDPENGDVMERIDALYGVLGKRDEQIRILRQRISATGDDAGPGLTMRLAEMLVEDARDLDGAFEIVKSVLSVEPSNQHAVGLMTVLAGEPLFSRRATDALRKAFLESGDNSGLLKAVEAQIGAAREVSDLIEMHSQAAVAAAGLGMVDRELEHLGSALALDPSDGEVLEKTMDCIGRGGDAAAGWAVLRKAAQAASWQDLEKKLLLMAVDTAIQIGFDDFAAVESALRRVLEIDPTSRPALDLLDAAYTRDSRPDELIGVLRHRLRLDLGAMERASVQARIGSIHEGRQEWKAAAEAFEEAVALGAVDAPLLKRLRRCYQILHNVRAEIDVIERTAQIAADDQSRFALLIEIAGLQETDLGDVRAARATLERIVAVDEFHVGARAALEHIYEELEDWESLTRLLGYTVESDLPVAERMRAALKAVSIAANEADNVTLAIAFARKAAQIDPASAEVNDELLRLYYKTEDWTSLIAVMRRKAEHTREDREKVLLLTQAANIARESVGDNGLAAMIADEILTINPDQPDALLTMARVREVEGSLDDALQMYRRLSGMKTDSGTIVEAFLGISRVLGLQGAPAEDVAAALQLAAEVDPDHPSVKGFLKQVYIDRRDFGKVIELLNRDLAEAGNDDDRAAIAMDIADIYRTQVGDNAGFIEFAEKSWSYRKDDPRVVGGIVDHYLGSGEDSKAIPYLEWLVNYLEAKRRLKELPPYAHELGRILESTGDTRRAVDYYRICHEHDASNIGNTLALARLHLKHGDMEKALRVLQPLLLRIDSVEPEPKREILLSLARIHENRGDPKKARQFVTRLLSEQPDCAEAREMLSRL